MFKKLLVSGLFLMQATAFAAVNDSNSSMQNTSAGNSAAARSTDKYQVDAQILGLGFSTSTQKIGLGIYMNPTSMLQLNLYSLLTQSTAEGQKVDGKEAGVGSAIELAYKSFHSNSFYSQFGVYSRTQTIATHTLHSGFSSAAVGAIGGDIEDIGVTFKIGNQWNWDTFTLGCDWVGYNAALTKETTGTVEDSDVSGLSLLGFYLGASF